MESECIASYNRRARFVAVIRSLRARAATVISGCPTAAEITATLSAPVPIIAPTFSLLVHPRVITGIETPSSISRMTTRPWPGPALSLEVVEKIGRKRSPYRMKREVWIHKDAAISVIALHRAFRAKQITREIHPPTMKNNLFTNIQGQNPEHEIKLFFNWQHNLRGREKIEQGYNTPY